jgi:hypothetical protein
MSRIVIVILIYHRHKPIEEEDILSTPGNEPQSSCLAARKHSHYIDLATQELRFFFFCY